MQAADAYAQWARDASAFLETADDTAAGDPVDMDAAIARHCRETGAPEPAEIEQRRLLHMEILYRQIKGESSQIKMQSLCCKHDSMQQKGNSMQMKGHELNPQPEPPG